MTLTQGDVARLRCWKEGECCQRDTGRPADTQHLAPMLPKVCFAIVARHAGKAKTARGKLMRAAEAIRLILCVLEGGAA